LTILTKIAGDGGEGVSNVRIDVQDGNSGMTPFKNAIKRTDTHLKLRDAYISQIEKLTAQGKAVTSQLDGRIRYTFK